MDLFDRCSRLTKDSIFKRALLKDEYEKIINSGKPSYTIAREVLLDASGSTLWTRRKGGKRIGYPIVSHADHQWN